MENQDQINLLWAPRISNRLPPIDLEAIPSVVPNQGMLDDSFQLVDDDSDDFLLDVNDEETRSVSEEDFILFDTKFKFCDYITKHQQSNNCAKKNYKLRA